MTLFSSQPLVGTPVHRLPIRPPTPAPCTTEWSRDHSTPVLAFPAVSIEPVAKFGGCGVRDGHSDRPEQLGAIGPSPKAVLLKVLGHVEHRDSVVDLLARRQGAGCVESKDPNFKFERRRCTCIIGQRAPEPGRQTTGYQLAIVMHSNRAQRIFPEAPPPSPRPADRSMPWQ